MTAPVWDLIAARRWQRRANRSDDGEPWPIRFTASMMLILSSFSWFAERWLSYQVVCIKSMHSGVAMPAIRKDIVRLNASMNTRHVVD